MSNHLFLFCFFIFFSMPHSLSATPTMPDITGYNDKIAWENVFTRYSLQVRHDIELLGSQQTRFQTYCKRVIREARNLEDSARLYYYSMLQYDRYDALKITLYGEKITLVNQAFARLESEFRKNRARVRENMERYDSLIKEQKQFSPQFNVPELHKLLQENITYTELFRSSFADWNKAESGVTETLRQVALSLKEISRDSDARQSQVISSIFFNNESNFADTLPDAWLYLRYWAQDTLESLAEQAEQLGGISKRFFIFTALGMAGLLAFWMLFYRKFLCKLLEQKLPEVYLRRNQFRIFVIAISFWLSFYWSTHLVHNVDMSIPRQLSLGFLLLFIMKLAIALRMGKELQKNVHALYRIMEISYFISLLLSVNVISYKPLIILSTLLASTAFCAVAWKFYRGNFLLPERIFAFCTLINFLAAAILGFCGFAYVSLTLMLSWFVLVALMQGLLGVSHFAAELEKVDSRHQAVHRVIDKLILPLGWIALIIYMVQWLAGTFHVEQKFNELLSMEIVRQNMVKFDIRTVFMVMLSGVLLFFILSSLKMLLKTYLSESMEFGILPSVMILGNYVAWMLYTIVALLMLNVDYSGVLVILGGMSMGLGFGLKDMVENFLAGLILLVGQQVRPGDVVENCDTGVIGKIKQITVRATVVETFDGAVMTYPNAQVLGKEFKNWTSNNTMRRTSLTLGVAYGSDLMHAREVILDVLRQTPGVYGRPEPEVLLNTFNSSSVDFEVRYWTNVLRSPYLKSDIQQTIYKNFAAAGIEIPFPQLDVHFPDEKAQPSKPAL